MARSTILHLLILTLLLLPSSSSIKGSFAAAEFLPTGQIEYRSVDSPGGSRRLLAPFQLCLECRCCAAADPSNCSSMPCCFGIDCNLPNKPFGVCAFVPKTCNCTGCA